MTSTLSLEQDEYKKQILDGLAAGQFKSVYGGLLNAKPSGDGWMLACCPFHEDGNPSFGYNTQTGHWRCFSGCGQGDVFGYLMRRDDRSFKEVISGLGGELGVAGSETEVPSEVTYDYTDEQGKLLYQVIKRPGKKFVQRRPTEGGKWEWNLKGVTRVLYRLPDIQARPGEPVYIAEGEKDADRLRGLGLLATTSPGGAGKWRDSYAEVLIDRDIIILPDNDKPGQDHAEQIARSLKGKAATVKVVPLPGLPQKGDVSDWLEAGGTNDQLMVLAADTALWEAESEGAGHPQIQLFDCQLKDVINEVWRLINSSNDPPSLFLANAGLARVKTTSGLPHIDLLDEPKAYGLLIRLADWHTRRGQNVVATKPPKEVGRDILANPHSELPILDAVVTTPVFDRDWRLVAEPGYHPESKLWFHGDQGRNYAISTYPSIEEVTKARSLILGHLLCDFPFNAASDLAHAIAALVLPFARRMFTGPTPMHMVEASTPGTGKSLLGDLISIIFTGRPCESTTITRNEDESRKKLTAILSRGAAIVTIDNLQGGMDSAQISSAITADTWSDRILGQSKMVQFPNTAVWLVTANNPKLSMEIARRCIRIRMEPAQERPWERTGFKHDPIREWVLQNRQELISAVLVIIQNWIVSGCPVATKTLGSFESWSRVIGGIVTHMGVPGFLQNTDEFYEAADSESGEWRAFVAAWQEEFQGAPVTAGQLMTLAETQELIPFAYAARTEHAQKIRFGRSLTNLRGRKFGEFQVVAETDNHKKTKTYRLVPAEVGVFK